MDRAAAEQLIRKSYEARRRNEIDATLDCFHPDACFSVAGTQAFAPTTSSFTGHGQLREGFRQMFPAWDWSRFQVEAILIEGERAAVHCKGTLVFTPTGQEVETQLVDLIRIQDGRIVDFIEFLDTRALAKTIGAVEA
jgi:ketosteroid isomerase-like protein